MKTKRYWELVRLAGAVLNDVNGDGWRLARYTFDAVASLQRSEGVTQGQAQEMFARDVSRTMRFSTTSVRRYFDVWRKYGKERMKDDSGKEFSFAEHYAMVRGGRNAVHVMQEARRRGAGAQSAAQNLIVFDGRAVSGALKRVVEVAKALEDLSALNYDGHALTDEELDALRRLERQIKSNLGAVQQIKKLD